MEVQHAVVVALHLEEQRHLRRHAREAACVRARPRRPLQATGERRLGGPQSMKSSNRPSGPPTRCPRQKSSRRHQANVYLAGFWKRCQKSCRFRPNDKSSNFGRIQPNLVDLFCGFARMSPTRGRSPRVIRTAPCTGSDTAATIHHSAATATSRKRENTSESMSRQAPCGEQWANGSPWSWRKQ